MALLRITVLFLLPFFAFSQSYTKRLALVIGNAEYQHGGVLKNPTNDARAIALALKDMGFEVMKYENVTQTQLKQAINAYGIKLKEYEVGLFYYAGHGIQHKGLNYMIPVEADLQAAEQIEFDCVAADRVLAFMEAASTKMNVIIMDACRNNPFERSWNRSVEGNGLALMNAPTGSIIAYATAPGRVASDGNAGNGLYTSALLKYMRDPGLNIEQVFKRVRTEVSEKSLGAQIPWETTSLTGSDFYFVKPREAVANRVVATTTPLNNSAKAVELYSQGNEKYDIQDYEGAITDYTNAINQNEIYWEAYLWRAHALYATTKYEEAMADYNKVLELSPGESQAYYYRGLCKFNLTQYADALPDLTLSIKYDPQNANGYYWRGYTYYFQQKYVAALDDFTKTLSLSPEFAEGLYIRGLTYYTLEDYAKGLADFIEARRIKPDYAEALLWRANSEFMLADYTTALNNYNTYLTISPSDPEGYYWRAYTYHYLNQPARALNDINKALELSPNQEVYLSFKKDVLKK